MLILRIFLVSETLLILIIWGYILLERDKPTPLKLELTADFSRITGVFIYLIFGLFHKINYQPETLSTIRSKYKEHRRNNLLRRLRMVEEIKDKYELTLMSEIYFTIRQHEIENKLSEIGD